MALAFAAAPAHAANWSVPTPIAGSEGDFPRLVSLAASGAAGLFVGGPLTLVPVAEPQLPIALSARAAGGGFARPVPLGAYGEPIAMSPSGLQSIAVAGARSTSDYFSLEHGKPSKLRVVIQKLGAPLHRIAAGNATATRFIDAAVNDSGDAVVMYSRCRTVACSTTSVWAILRHHGRAFSKPVPLAGKTFSADGSVAINPSGDALLAWSESRAGASVRTYDVRTRLWKASGHLTKLRRAGPTVAHPQIDITLSTKRAGTVAWFSEPVSEGSVGGPATISAARVSSDGRIGRRVVLDRFSPPPVSNGANAVGGARLRSILDPDGSTTIAWTGHDNRYLVRAVRFPGGGEAQTLSAGGSNAELTDLAGDPDGDAVAIWIGGSQPAALGGTPVPGVSVAVRSGAKASFGPPELPLVNSNSRIYRTAAVAIARGPHVLLAAGGEFAANPSSQPVVVTDRTGTTSCVLICR
jgi:hypothetical protein